MTVDSNFWSVFKIMIALKSLNKKTKLMLLNQLWQKCPPFMFSCILSASILQFSFRCIALISGALLQLKEEL